MSSSVAGMINPGVSVRALANCSNQNQLVCLMSKVRAEVEHLPLPLGLQDAIKDRKTFDRCCLNNPCYLPRIGTDRLKALEQFLESQVVEQVLVRIASRLDLPTHHITSMQIVEAVRTREKPTEYLIEIIKKIDFSLAERVTKFLSGHQLSLEFVRRLGSEDSASWRLVGEGLFIKEAMLDNLAAQQLYDNKRRIYRVIQLAVMEGRLRTNQELFAALRRKFQPHRTQIYRDFSRSVHIFHET